MTPVNNGWVLALFWMYCTLLLLVAYTQKDKQEIINRKWRSHPTETPAANNNTYSLVFNCIHPPLYVYIHRNDAVKLSIVSATLEWWLFKAAHRFCLFLFKCISVCWSVVVYNNMQCLVWEFLFSLL